jgi:hypothetical protein
MNLHIRPWRLVWTVWLSVLAVWMTNNWWMLLLMALIQLDVEPKPKRRTE